MAIKYQKCSKFLEYFKRNKCLQKNKIKKGEEKERVYIFKI